jgi:hypothetical protein
MQVEKRRTVIKWWRRGKRVRGGWSARVLMEERKRARERRRGGMKVLVMER